MHKTMHTQFHDVGLLAIANTQWVVSMVLSQHAFIV